MIEMKNIRYLLCNILFLSCVAILLILPGGKALASNGGAGSVNPFYGSFSTEVPIGVPEYHGIEPRIKLVYSSTGGNSFAGAGWSLLGQSFIERGCPGAGAPTYSSKDVFYMDGQELIPSTLQGGTHCTRPTDAHRAKFPPR